MQFAGFTPWFTKSELSPSSRSVIIAISSFLPTPFPSLKAIQENTGLCRNTVLKHLKILEEKKFLKRIRRYGTSNLYRLNPAILLKKVYDKAEQCIKQKAQEWAARLAKKKVVKKNGTTLVPFSGVLTISSLSKVFKPSVIEEKTQTSDYLV